MPIPIPIPIIASDMTITSTSIVSHVGIRFAGWVIVCALRSHVMYRKSASGCERVHCSSNRCCHQKAGPVTSLGWIWRSSLVAHESKSMAHRNKARCDPASVGTLRPPASYAFSRPSSANFLRGLLCNVVLSISPHRQNAVCAFQFFANYSIAF